jgi:hypothetical protein
MLSTGSPSTRCHKPGDLNLQSKLLRFSHHKLPVRLNFVLEFAYPVILGTILTVLLQAVAQLVETLR